MKKKGTREKALREWRVRALLIPTMIRKSNPNPRNSLSIIDAG
jgi:hypothetical protein